MESKYFCDGDMVNMGGDPLVAIVTVCSCSTITKLIITSSCLLILLIIVTIHVASEIVWRNEGGSLMLIFTNITTTPTLLCTGLYIMVHLEYKVFYK